MFNSELSAGMIKRYCVMDNEAKEYLENIFENMEFSAEGISQGPKDCEDNSRYGRKRGNKKKTYFRGSMLPYRR